MRHKGPAAAFNLQHPTSQLGTSTCTIWICICALPIRTATTTTAAPPLRPRRRDSERALPLLHWQTKGRHMHVHIPTDLINLCTHGRSQRNASGSGQNGEWRRDWDWVRPIGRLFIRTLGGHFFFAFSKTRLISKLMSGILMADGSDKLHDFGCHTHKPIHSQTYRRLSAASPNPISIPIPFSLTLTCSHRSHSLPASVWPWTVSWSKSRVYWHFTYDTVTVTGTVTKVTENGTALGTLRASASLRPYCDGDDDDAWVGPGNELGNVIN